MTAQQSLGRSHRVPIVCELAFQLVSGEDALHSHVVPTAALGGHAAADRGLPAQSPLVS